jgi:hypothetical protein
MAPSQARFLVAVQKKIAPCFRIFGASWTSKGEEWRNSFLRLFFFLELAGWNVE